MYLVILCLFNAEKKDETLGNFKTIYKTYKQPIKKIKTND
jgi:hypothetical protein